MARALNRATASAPCRTIGRVNAGEGQFGGQRTRQGSRAGTDVENPKRLRATALCELQRAIDQRLGFGSRNEHRLVDRELPAVETRAPEQVRDRNACRTPPAQLAKALRFARRYDRLAVCDKPRSTTTEYVRQKNLRIGATGISGRFEAPGALREQPADGGYRFFDAFSNPVRNSSRFITGTSSTLAFNSRKSGSTIDGMSDGSCKSKMNVADRFPSVAEKYVASGFNRAIVFSRVFPRVPFFTAAFDCSTGKTARRSVRIVWSPFVASLVCNQADACNHASSPANARARSSASRSSTSCSSCPLTIARMLP